MGKLVNREVGVSRKSSQRRALLEKAQAELRRELDEREEKRRELEHLLQGGNPLDFRRGHTTPVSVQSTPPTGQPSEEVHPELVNTAHEDAVLEQCRIIEAKHKRFADILGGAAPSENRGKSQWDFVLEEMAWLANDFLQERCWKITAAAKVCHQIAADFRSRFEKQDIQMKHKKLASDVAKYVKEFWKSAERMKKDPELQCSPKAVWEYAQRFVEYNSSLDDKCGFSMPEMSLDEHLIEENLFYVVPPGSMGKYRKSIEQHFEERGICTQDEEASVSPNILNVGLGPTTRRRIASSQKTLDPSTEVSKRRKLPREHSSKKSSSYPVNAGGSSGRVGQRVSKKRRMTDLPPVASQTGNMSLDTKLLGGCQGKRGKSSKTPDSQPGLESEWSAFENQALSVLVYDLGPNWELISDAINSSFKHRIRKSNECKEQYDALMNNAENYGLAQLHPTTSPDLPKGDARVLFQCLQERREENSIKSRFDKIISISQKWHCSRTKTNDEKKKPIQPHGSHAVALFQVCPSTAKGDPPLTPLDLCETSIPTPGSLVISGQDTVASALPVSGASNALQGEFTSSGASLRDDKYGVPGSPGPSYCGNMDSGVFPGQEYPQYSPWDDVNEMPCYMHFLVDHPW